MDIRDKLHHNLQIGFSFSDSFDKYIEEQVCSLVLGLFTEMHIHQSEDILQLQLDRNTFGLENRFKIRLQQQCRRKEALHDSYLLQVAKLRW